MLHDVSESGQPMTPLAACLVTAIQFAADLRSLAAWWSAHQAALQLLEPGEMIEVVAAKDRRKVELSR